MYTGHFQAMNPTVWFKCNPKFNGQIFITLRNSHQMYSIKKLVLKNVAKFNGKHLCQSLFLNKVAGLRPATLLKKRLWYRCFPVNFAELLSTTFMRNTSGRLLLYSADILSPAEDTSCR